MRKYRLTIDEKQADALIAALDLYPRLHSGQYEKLREIGLSRAREGTDWTVWHRRNDSLITDLRGSDAPDLGAVATMGVLSGWGDRDSFRREVNHGL